MIEASIDIDRVLRQTFVARAEHHHTLSSTNDRAAELAIEEPGELPLLIVADRQTAGRGRGTNKWWTGRGSLAMSLVLDAAAIRVEQDRTPLISLAAAVAIVDTAAPLLPAHTVGVNWPNDVMADGGKLAGILIEVLQNRLAVVGIGINTNNSPADAPCELQGAVATLQDLSGERHDRTAVLIDLLGHLEDCFEKLASDYRHVAARADELCLQHGRTLTLRQGSRTITGRCEGIAPDGALLLETSTGRQRCYCGVLL